MEGVQTLTAEDDVRQASDRFYAALSAGVSGDASLMGEVWSHGADVTTMHPIGEREVGWEQVWPMWQMAASAFQSGKIHLRDQLIQAGTDMAYEVGIEEGEALLGGQQVQFRHRVTNVYRQEGGAWKIMHHHADASPEMNEILASPQPPASA
jgi:ketosteroid isomerase-like protein